MNWIDVNDEIPDEEVSVLVMQHGDDICDHLVVQAAIFEGFFYADHENGLISFDDHLEVTHWMPLPAPPSNV